MKYLLAVLVLGGSLIAGVPAHASTGQMCYELYKPVCALQQVECFAAPCYPVYHTYSNECFANVANAKILHEGECTAAESGPYKGDTGTSTSTHPTHPVPPAHPVTPTPPVATSTMHASTTATTTTPVSTSTASTTQPVSRGFIHTIIDFILHLFGLK